MGSEAITQWALRVDAARYGEPQQVPAGGFFGTNVRIQSKHDGADFHCLIRRALISESPAKDT